MMKCCVSCMDEDEEVAFRCRGNGGLCSYQLCAICVRLAFEDGSGANSAFCSMCKAPTAIDMIASVCGRGAIMAVEQKLRGKVEFKLKEETMKREASRSNARDMNEHARRIFNELAEKINLKCPRCKAAFHDYDGCNALKCGAPGCNAGFCAICLKDCGNDAHQHIYTVHKGQIFDKDAFDRSRIERAQTQIDALKEELSHEPFELKQLVLNHIEKANLTQETNGSNRASAKEAAFLEKTKKSLLRATRHDRLALLSNPEEYNQLGPLSRQDISPRCAVPRDYQLSLVHKQGDLYRVRLEHQLIEGEDHWVHVDDIEKHFKEYPKIESLLNIKQTLRCAVIAIEGRAQLYQTSKGVDMPEGYKLDNDEVCIRLRGVEEDGRVLYEEMNNYQRRRELSIVGLNQNKRMLLLEKHVETTSDDDLMFEPLKHLIGAGQPTSVITEMEMDVPESQVGLNEEQMKVAHPLRLKTAMEVAGPPGTGKTKTIVELVRALLQCTNHDILLLSERNGAINAVAEKFKSESLITKGTKTEIKDVNVWTSVMTYGAGDTMGEHTKLFTLEEKLRMHPELEDLQEKRDMLTAASKALSQTLRDKLAEVIFSFSRRFNEPRAANRIKEIKTNKVHLSSPLSIIGAVEAAADDIEGLLRSTVEQRHKYVQEDSTSSLVVSHSDLVGGLVFIRPDTQREDKKSDPWDAKEATKRLRFILDRFAAVLRLDEFSPDTATQLYEEKAAADEEYKALFTRLEAELFSLARLHMSTIGSSHRLPTGGSDNDKDLSQMLDRLAIEDIGGDGESEPPKVTICIFDEAGCIPAYELLGLTRLGRSLHALILVGDKHQLPPYDPMQGRRFGRTNSFGAARMRTRTKSEKMLSLLDSSALTVDSGKVMLTTQYRVPRDIADMLNQRVYRGQYNTCPNANVPRSGLNMVNVQWSESPRRKYVNPNEVVKGLNLLNQLSLDPSIASILVITPYKNQQREFEFQLQRLRKEVHISETTVLTIDQCQGQEADAVILSFVRKPTPFLTLNRLNVALSRVRKKLYVLTDFRDLKEKCRDKDWECAHLAADLLLDFV